MANDHQKPNQNQISSNISFCLINKNITSTDVRSAGPQSDPAVLAWQYLVGALSIIGAIFNATALLALFRHRNLRSGAGFFIGLLITINLILSVLLVPTSVYLVSRTALGFRPVYCQACRYYRFFHATTS
ncbi:hypothetical protein BV898_02941 [Hypsibius exemplaris]|uniref:G-protein coupled receptors family 1 profile domain-containing protein n=1 Tax=Hypsibius exemplaris TaxID=2072580 RepID=A0A1W0X731_HYPEX|nr:hypothetical protein BV898_02941 [Hypsibius exemplaris]